MKRILVWLALLLALPSLGHATATPPEPLAVALKEHVVVQGDIVHLGDLFHGLGERAATEIARAPEPGTKVELNARWLTALAQSYRLPWRPNSRLDRVVVERASHIIDAERVSGLIGERIARDGGRGEISVALDNPALQLHLPTAVEASIRLVGFVHDPKNGRFRGKLVVPAAGPAVLESFVSGRAIEMVEVPVLRHRIAVGQTIAEDDIDWSKVRADRLPRNVVVAAADLIGLAPRRPIAPDGPIRADELRTPIVIAKNSLVVIRLQTDRMHLTAQGRALEDGASGAVIRVMNTKSNTIINAVVVDSGRVTVPMASLAAAQ